MTYLFTWEFPISFIAEEDLFFVWHKADHDARQWQVLITYPVHICFLLIWTKLISHSCLIHDARSQDQKKEKFGIPILFVVIPSVSFTLWAYYHVLTTAIAFCTAIIAVSCPQDSEVPVLLSFVRKSTLLILNVLPLHRPYFCSHGSLYRYVPQWHSRNFWTRTPPVWVFWLEVWVSWLGLGRLLKLSSWRLLTASHLYWLRFLYLWYRSPRKLFREQAFAQLPCRSGCRNWFRRPSHYSPPILHKLRNYRVLTSIEMLSEKQFQKWLLWHHRLTKRIFWQRSRATCCLFKDPIHSPIFHPMVRNSERKVLNITFFVYSWGGRPFWEVLCLKWKEVRTRTIFSTVQRIQRRNFPARRGCCTSPHKGIFDVL